MKVLVTGGSGYIGTHLIESLISQGHIVHALVRTPSRATHLIKPGIDIFNGDLTDISAVMKAMSGCKQVYHMGGCASVWERDPRVYYTINVEGTRNVLDAAIHHKVEKVVFTSTAGVLGPSISGVVHESKSRDIDFFNEYESSKAHAESLVKSYVTDFGLDAVIVSPTRVYGPYIAGQPGSITLIISKFIQGKWRFIPGDGTKIGNYVFVDDVVSGHLLAMLNGQPGGTYILGGDNYTYNEFFATLKEVSGSDYFLIKMPVFIQKLFAHIVLFFARLRGVTPAVTIKWIRRGNYHWEVCVDKAKNNLGYSVTPLKVGLKKTVTWAEKSSKGAT